MKICNFISYKLHNFTLPDINISIDFPRIGGGYYSKVPET